LAAGGYERKTVEIFLATSTAWQRVATRGSHRYGVNRIEPLD
jgi:hypothetical protein